MINFSVIIPLYNKSETIFDTVNSVLNQTYPHFELIIVNDGSTDDSLDVVNTVVDSRIRLINKPNSGVSDARNLGVAEAKYDWIAMLDGDDLKTPTALQEIAEAIRKYPKYKIFSTGYSIIESQSQKTKYTNKFLPIEGETGIIDYIDCTSAGEPPINSSNSVIHSDIFKKYGGFVSGHKNYEDHELWMRIYEENSIVFINKELLHIRRDLEGTARQNKILVKDINTYLNTIALVKGKLNKGKKMKLMKFLNKFCAWYVYRLFGNYSKQEQKSILLTMKKVLSPFVFLGIKTFSNLRIQ